MKKYYLVAKNTWDEILSYRINFILWRFRAVLTLLIGYFLWTSVMPDRGVLFGYTKEMMVSYVLLAPVVFSIVFSTRTHEIGENINKGDLAFFLLKPFGYFRYWFARDVGDKLMNFCFCVVEITLLIWILQPNVFIQTNVFYILLFLISLFLAICLNFFICCLMSMIGFWSPDVWAPRFVFYTLVSFFAGSLFPLDILPYPIFNALNLLPFPYLQYFPVKIYLGQLGLPEILTGFLVSIVWTFIGWVILRGVWGKGLRIFTSAGG